MASTDRDDEGKNTNPGHGLSWERKMQQGSPEMPKIQQGVDENNGGKLLGECRKSFRRYMFFSLFYLFFSITFPFASCNLAVLETGASTLSHSVTLPLRKLINTQMPHVTSLFTLTILIVLEFAIVCVRFWSEGLKVRVTVSLKR